MPVVAAISFQVCTCFHAVLPPLCPLWLLSPRWWTDSLPSSSMPTNFLSSSVSHSYCRAEFANWCLPSHGITLQQVCHMFTTCRQLQTAPTDLEKRFVDRWSQQGPALMGACAGGWLCAHCNDNEIVGDGAQRKYRLKITSSTCKCSLAKKTFGGVSGVDVYT